MFTVMEASNFTPSVYSVHALTLLAEVNIHLLFINQRVVLRFLLIMSQVALTGV